MPTIEQLRFAQRFPFSSLARRIVKELGLSLDDLDEEAVGRAAIMVSHAFSGKRYALDINTSELLEHEIVAFPIAKLLVSAMKNPSLYKGFSLMVARSTFFYLESSPERKQLCLDLAEDLSIDFEVVEEKGVFVSLPLHQYLAIGFSDASLKLVNQSVEGGRVFLNVNAFCRFLREAVFSRVLGSLPVETSGLPQGLKALAGQLSQQLRQTQFEGLSFRGESKGGPNDFPPCVASLYQRLGRGERLPHMARFFLATFLSAVGMPQQQIAGLFKKSPDYNEKIVSYQLRRIAGQKYAPASCEKVDSYGLCPRRDCGVRHPLSYYRKRLKPSGGKSKSNKFG
jgi:DNA primase large subunit